MAEIMAYIGKRDIANCLRWTAEYVETGSDLAQFVRDMAEHVRDLYVMAVAGEDVELDVTETMRRQLSSELQWFGPDRTVRCMGVLGDSMAELKTSSNPRLSFEIALTRLVRPDSDLTLESLAERIEALESGYSAVSHVLPGDPIIPGEETATRVRSGQEMTEIRNRAERVGGASTGARGDASAAGGTMEKPATAAADSAATSAAFLTAAPVVAATETPATVAAAVPAAAVSVTPAAAATAAPVVVATASAVAGTSSAAPASANEAASGSASPYANAATLQRTWQAAMTAVKKHKIAYGALFMNTRIRFNQQTGAVEIEFPAESTFAYNAVQKPEAREALVAAWQKATGSAMEFVYKLGGGASASAVVAASAASSPASPAPAVAPAAKVQPAAIEAPAAEARPVAASAAPAVETQSTAAAPVATPELQAAPSSADVPVYDDEPPYEQVPYEDFDIDEQSYDDYPASDLQPAYAPAQVQEPAAAPMAGEALAAAASAPVASPAAEATPDDLNALLQAGFGTSVHFEEVDGE